MTRSILHYCITDQLAANIVWNFNYAKRPRFRFCETELSQLILGICKYIYVKYKKKPITYISDVVSVEKSMEKKAVTKYIQRWLTKANYRILSRRPT